MNRNATNEPLGGTFFQKLFGCWSEKRSSISVSKPQEENPAGSTSKYAINEEPTANLISNEVAGTGKICPLECGNNTLTVETQHTSCGKLHFNGFPQKASEKKIKKLFANYGPLRTFEVKKDDSGQLLGFGHVEYVSSDDANEAMKAIEGSCFGGKTIHVSTFIPKFSVPLTNETDSAKENSKVKDTEINQRKEIVIKITPKSTRNAKSSESINTEDKVNLANNHNRENSKGENNEGVVYIKYLIDDIKNEKHLKRILGNIGEISYAKLYKDINGEHTGFAKVRFRDPCDAKKALKFDSLKLQSGNLVHLSQVEGNLIKRNCNHRKK